jgi:hypothetical protein
VKAIPQALLKNFREIDVGLSPQFIHPCGDCHSFCDASLGLFLPNNIHADGDKGGGMPMRQPKILYGSGRRNRISLHFQKVEKSLQGFPSVGEGIFKIVSTGEASGKIWIIDAVTIAISIKNCGIDTQILFFRHGDLSFPAGTLLLHVASDYSREKREMQKGFCISLGIREI